MDKTLIVIWSDHGYFLGEKGLWYKRKAFERSARVPLLISAPGFKAGRSPRPVELIDLYPTITELSGHGIPDGLDGASLRPLLQNPQRQWSRPAITQVYHNAKAFGYSMRTERWRYTEWNHGKAGTELYDHSKDPEEITNLAESAEHAAVVESLSKQLHSYSKNR